MNKKKLFNGRFFSKKLLLPLMLVSFAGFGVVQLTPLLIQGTGATQPATWQLAVVGAALIALSAAFLTYTARLIGLSRGWLVLGVIFSSVMVILKFILIPRALYSQEYRLEGWTYFDPNDPANYFWIGLLLFCLYASVFIGAYKHYRVDLRLKLGDVKKGKTKATSTNESRSSSQLLAIILVIV